MRKREEVTVPDLDLDTVVNVLDEGPVTLAVLYGSYARGDTTAKSDIDFAVEFEESLSSIERTRARLGLIERLTTELGTDEIDVTPLARVSSDLLREILADGILVYGSPADLERHYDQSVEESNHRDRIAAFDDLLGELERVV